MADTPIENQNLPVKGWHGVLQMQDPGASAGDFVAMNTIGWVASVSLDISNSSEAYFAIGDRVAKQTRRGQTELSGSIGRAFIDSSLIRLMFGRTEDTNILDLGSLDVSANLVSLKLQVRDDSTGHERIVVITLTEVILERVSIEYGAEDNIMENVDYQAGDITIDWDGAVLAFGAAGKGYEWDDAGANSYGPNMEDLVLD